MSKHGDVIIVGGGVVGAAAARALLADGLNVILVERAAPQRAADDPRVYALTPASAALLETLGVWDELPRTPYRRMQVWSAAPERALHFDAAEAARAELGWIVPHGPLLDALWSELPPRRLRIGQAPVALSQDAGAVSLKLADGQILQAPLLIACDGARSRIRDWAGIDTDARSYAQQALVATVQTAQPHRACARQRFCGADVLALLPLQDGRCSLVWSTPDAMALQALDETAFCARLGEASQYVLGEVQAAGPRVVAPLQWLHAQRYVSGRVVLAGDSAHALHPLAGQGVNLGLADLAALRHTLARLRAQGRDLADPRALARYQRARQADNLDMLTLTDALARGFAAPVPGLPGLLDWGLNLVDRAGPLKHWLIRRATGV
jgi:ubiquinone biosynthesis UbiH/UbiF/VisC/COQ6 family hydroxylase